MAKSFMFQSTRRHVPNNMQMSSFMFQSTCPILGGLFLRNHKYLIAKDRAYVWRMVYLAVSMNCGVELIVISLYYMTFNLIWFLSTILGWPGPGWCGSAIREWYWQNWSPKSVTYNFQVQFQLHNARKSRILFWYLPSFNMRICHNFIMWNSFGNVTNRFWQILSRIWSPL